MRSLLSIPPQNYQWALDLRRKLARLCPDTPRFIFSYQRLPGSVVVDFISRGFRRLPPAASADQIHETIETVMAAESRDFRQGLLFEKDAATYRVNLVGENGPKPFNSGEGEILLIWTMLVRNAGQVCTLHELALAARCSLKEVNSYICRLRFRYERMRRDLGTTIAAKDFIQTREDGYLLNARQRK